MREKCEELTIHQMKQVRKNAKLEYEKRSLMIQKQVQKNDKLEYGKNSPVIRKPKAIAILFDLFLLTVAILIYYANFQYTQKLVHV